MISSVTSERAWDCRHIDQDFRIHYIDLSRRHAGDHYNIRIKDRGSISLHYLPKRSCLHNHRRSEEYATFNIGQVLGLGGVRVEASVVVECKPIDLASPISRPFASKN